MARGQQSAVPGQVNPVLGTFFNLTGKSVYDPTKFYTAGTDSKGHYERVRLRVTPSIQAMCEQVVGQVADYGSVEDFLRDAALHRIMYFQNTGIAIDEERLKMELHTAEMANQRAKMKARNDYIEDCQSTIDAAIDDWDWDTLVDTIEEMKERVETGGFPPVTKTKLEDCINDAERRMFSGRSAKQDRRRTTGQD